MTDADGNIAQHVEYIPYGEVFVEERNSQFSTNFLFNAKELDNETGLYYYGARYLDPTGAMWLSVDPMWEKYIDATPYNYCHGNPITMVDPDGRVECDAEGKIDINYNVNDVIALLDQRYASGVAPDATFNTTFYDSSVITIGDNGRVQYDGYDVGIARTDRVDDKPGSPFLVLTKDNGTLDESSNCFGLAMLGGQAALYNSYEATVIINNEYTPVTTIINDDLSNLQVGDVITFTASGNAYPGHHVALIKKDKETRNFWDSSFNMGFTRKDGVGPATLCYGEPKEALIQSSIGGYPSASENNMAIYRSKNYEKRFSLRNRYSELPRYDGSH